MLFRLSGPPKVALRLAGAAIAVVALNILPAIPEASARIAPAGSTFKCTVKAIWDGDGPLLCREGVKIRIAGVAAREIDDTCRPYQPCPPVSGVEARDRLVRLFGGARGRTADGHIIVRSAPMRCVSDGPAKGSRTAAWCTSPVFGDLSCAVVRSGGAVRWMRYWRQHRCS